MPRAAERLMEGPSLHLAAQQLQPFVGQRIGRVRGNTTLDKVRLKGRTVKRIFAWGKHLVIQCEEVALRIHFLLFGSFSADVEGGTVTGDYRPTRDPRLALTFANGELRTYACSVVFLETDEARRLYDFRTDVMARQWDPALALLRMKDHPKEMIADVLLDQDLFAGVGNIIKNEVLSLEGIHPARRVEDLRPVQRKAVVQRARSFAKRFFRWRRDFVLYEKLRIHRRDTCPTCGGPVTHQPLGKRKRTAHFCPRCQPSP